MSFGSFIISDIAAMDNPPPFLRKDLACKFCSILEHKVVLIPTFHIQEEMPVFG